MGRRVGRDLLVACFAAALGWFGHLMLRDGDAGKLGVVVLEGEASSAPAGSSSVARRAPSEQVETPRQSLPARSDDAAGAESISPVANVATSVPAEITVTRPLILSPAVARNATDGAESQTPQTPSPEDATRDRLRNALMLRCDFKPGGTAFWPNGEISSNSFEWKGGPIAFDMINLEAGTARLTGSTGATGSTTGQIDVAVVATDTGLHFSAFTPRQTTVVTTVFSNLDRSGRFRAVMSRHGTPAFSENISEQVYGSCDIGMALR